MTENGSLEEDEMLFLETLQDLAINDEERRCKRPLCERCSRPKTVCWCPFLPHEPLTIRTTIYILQHPFEDSRPLRTAPMLYHSLAPGKCHIFRGKKFTPQRYPELVDLFRRPNTLLLYPGPEAVDISSLPPQPPGCDSDTGYNLVIIDGTWSQAHSLYCHHNPNLPWPKQVQITSQEKSKYVIRTQPTETSLSTLECAAISLSILERKPDLAQILTRPLDALCHFQLHYGAVTHHSKQFLIENGLYQKQMPRVKAAAKSDEDVDKL